ncbi:hypothetical protein ACTXG7_25710 [Mycolicibacterium sp. Dal123E01]|uniref:hypothetical protein n=1 Tax=Mycolicibacterium sp. Dal123E01 TaxID=3457578 RepID=UPI00403E4130
MSVKARLHTKLAAALLAASVVATAPAVVGAGPESLPVLSNIAVRPASIVTDTLYGLGDIVSAATNAVVIGTDLALGLNYYWDDTDFGWGVPFNPVFWAATAIQNPGSALSYLLQTYLNPSDNYVDPSDPTNYYYAYPWFFKSDVIGTLVNLLPPGLATPLNNAVNGVADGINDFFATNLPDPTAAINQMWEQYNTPIGRLVYAAQATIGLPVTLASAVIYYAAYLPATLEATVESAIQTPADIPGLLSNLVYDALDPVLNQGLLGNLTYNLFKPAFFLPSPIGESGFGIQDGMAYSLYQSIVGAVSGLLSNLPTPIAPTPFPSAAASVPAAARTTSVAAQGKSSTGSPAAAAPKVRGTGESARRPAPQTETQSPSSTAQKQAKAGAKKAKGDSNGGQSHSARAGKAGSAA